MQVYNLHHQIYMKKTGSFDNNPDYLKQNPFLKVAHLFDKIETKELDLIASQKSELRNTLTLSNGMFEQEEKKVVTDFIRKNEQVLSEIKKAINYGAPLNTAHSNSSEASYNNNDRF